MNNESNKVAVVTGATKGIGRAISEIFADKGFDLAICARNASDLEAVKQSLTADHPGITVLTVQSDVQSRDDVLTFSKAVSDTFTRIDVLVNNAGVFIPGMIMEEDENTFDLLMKTNMYSAYHLTKSLAPNMISAGSGHIFNVCSVASLKAYPSGGSYSVSKFALYGFTKALREELKSTGVRVSAILPGATWSHSWKGSDVPPERMMEASDVAHMVWAAYAVGPRSVIEDIVMRPQLGDL